MDLHELHSIKSFEQITLVDSVNPLQTVLFIIYI